MLTRLIALLLILPYAACADPCESDADCQAVDFCNVEKECAELPAFPDDFLWGTAVAGFQVDYGCPTMAPERCEDRASDWFEFTTNEATVNSARAYLSGDHPSEVGPGFWELYDADFQRASGELNNNAFRMSIEWSRIFPAATDAANQPRRIDGLGRRR